MIKKLKQFKEFPYFLLIVIISFLHLYSQGISQRNLFSKSQEIQELKYYINTMEDLLFSQTELTDFFENKYLQEKTKKQKLIKEVQKNYVLAKVAFCESSFKHEDIWGKAGEYGYLQFKEQTFYWMAGLMDFKTAEWKNKSDQIIIFQWAVANGYGKHWSCYRKLLKKKL